MNKIHWRLGLDLGTNSIGWSVFSLDENKNPEELVDMGVRIFSDGRNPKTKEPLAVERRNARSQRKIIYRRKLRRKQTFHILQNQNLFPKTKEECMELKLLNPYELRVKALDNKLEPFELGRVLFNLSVRRGFKSNRKDGSREETTDKNITRSKLSQKDMQTALDKAICESNCRTLGEFLFNNQDKNGGLRFVPGRMTYYPTRKMYENEFFAIKEVQQQYYKEINWNLIYKTIFTQRPLKAQSRGYCQYLKDKERTFKAMPCSQKLRILQEIRNLRYYDAEHIIHEINDNQDKDLIDFLNSKEKVSFDQIRKLLGFNENYTFNLEENREYLIGNPTAVNLRKKNRFGIIWDSLTLEEQDNIVEKIITADEDQEVLSILEKYDLTEEQKQNIVQLVLPSGTAMLCKEVSEQIVARMEEVSDLEYDKAISSLGYEYANQKVEKYDVLPYYGKVLVGSTMGVNPAASEDQPEKKYGKISNPTVHVALNQTRVVINALIKEYGKPEQISIELSRELKQSREAKIEIARKQNERAKQNISINEKITNLYQIAFPGRTYYPNRTDRLKYRLWDELNTGSLGHRCLYCGKVISAAELFTKEIEIEHILPYSRTLLDSESNLTVAHSSCNAFKAENSPYEVFNANPKGYNWNEITARANQLTNPSKRNKFSPTAMESFEKDSSFIARQLTDNAYLSKIAYKYLHSICDNVWAVNGGMTKLLRDKWEMDSILKRKIDEKEIAHFGLKPEQIGNYKKNRLDHRHHAIDAVVIALTDRAMVKQISTLNYHSMKNRIEVPQLPILRSDLEEKVRNIVVSFKPDHGVEGKLSKETLLGKIWKNGNQVYVCRENILSLDEKKINTIVDEKIKKTLNNYIQKNKNEKIDVVLQKFSEEYNVKKVRCINRVQAPIEIKSGKIPRYLAPEDYFAAIIWELPPKKNGGSSTYIGQFIRRDQVEKNNKVKPNVIEQWKKDNSPVAKMICLLHKDDYLEFSLEGVIHKCRIAGYSASQNKLDIRPIYAVTDSADWICSTNEKQLEKGWKIQKGHYFVSINVLFGVQKAELITVNPIGKVFRK